MASLSPSPKRLYLDGRLTISKGTHINAQFLRPLEPPVSTPVSISIPIPVTVPVPVPGPFPLPDTTKILKLIGGTGDTIFKQDIQAAPAKLCFSTFRLLNDFLALKIIPDPPVVTVEADKVTIGLIEVADGGIEICAEVKWSNGPIITTPTVNGHWEPPSYHIPMFAGDHTEESTKENGNSSQVS